MDVASRRPADPAAPQLEPFEVRPHGPHRQPKERDADRPRSTRTNEGDGHPGNVTVRGPQEGQPPAVRHRTICVRRVQSLMGPGLPRSMAGSRGRSLGDQVDVRCLRRLRRFVHHPCGPLGRMSPPRTHRRVVIRERALHRQEKPGGVVDIRDAIRLPKPADRIKSGDVEFLPPCPG